MDQNKPATRRRTTQRLEVAMNMRSPLGAAAFAVAMTAAGPLAAATVAETAHAEYDEVMALTPDVDNGRRVYLTCAVCHRPEGWGSPDGTYPQIAGQLRSVIIKQLADVRGGDICEIVGQVIAANHGRAGLAGPSGRLRRHRAG